MKNIIIDDVTGIVLVIVQNDKGVSFPAQVKLADHPDENSAILAATTEAQDALNNAVKS
ncbi:hypothetical protein [Rouxiella sp. WC2420]|uniref:Uncharacterized protein n=1 Tax=Rouxiella sp. WC2420 TaxID=3234145 RepID=A0AB39VPA6_9GAMM